MLLRRCNLFLADYGTVIFCDRTIIINQKNFKKINKTFVKQFPTLETEKKK